MKTMLPYVTAGGSVYRAQIIGHFDKGNPVARLEVMLDATQHPTQVLFWKDMSNSASHLTVPLPRRGQRGRWSLGGTGSTSSSAGSTSTKP